MKMTFVQKICAFYVDEIDTKWRADSPIQKISSNWYSEAGKTDTNFAIFKFALKRRENINKDTLKPFSRETFWHTIFR